MRDQDPRLFDAGPPIGPGRKIGMNDQPEAVAMPGRAPTVGFVQLAGETNGIAGSSCPIENVFECAA